MGIGKRIVFLVAMAAAPLAAFAAPADPDPTFGVNGVQLLDFGGPAPVRVVASARQNSGKIVIAGQSPAPGSTRNRLVIGRLDIEGKPDLTFGNGGWAVIDDYSDLAPVAMALVSSDAIRVVGKRDGQRTFIATLDADGLLPGNVTVDYNYASLDESPRAMAWLGGQLAVAGTCNQFPTGQRMACVQMYDSYGNRGFGPVYVGGSSANSDALAVVWDECSSGGFYAAGRVEDASGNRDFFITKVKVDMQVDPAFGTRTVDFGGQDEAAAVAQRGCGHVMVAGRSDVAGLGHVAMASMSSFDGTLDITDNAFGTGGKVLLPMQWQGVAAEAGVSSLNYSWGSTFPDGIFALITLRPTPYESHVVAARFNRSGTLLWTTPLMGASIESDAGIGIHDIDPYRDSVIALASRNGTELVAAKYDMAGGNANAGYGAAGILHHQAYFTTQDSLQALAPFMGGYVGVVSGNSGVFNLFRARPDGSFDYSLGSNGLVPLESGSYQIAVQADGRIVTAHETHSVPWDPSSRIVVAVERYDGNGVPDNAFGRVLLDFGGNAVPAEMLVQPDGRILVAASVGLSNPSRTRMAVARLNSNGTLDASFSGGVALAVSGLSAEEEARSIALLADGRIVLGGRGSDSGFYNWTVYRLLPDGQRDVSWNAGGYAVMHGCEPQTNSKLALAPDNAVVVAGFVQRTNDTDTCFARFLADGTPDPTFGFSGLLVPYSGPGYESASGVAVDGYGRILATIGGSGGSALIRLNPDGSSDYSFGGGAAGVFVPGGGYYGLTGLIRQADEKLVVWGNANVFGDNDALLARFEGGGAPTPDTTPDPFSFGSITGVAPSSVVTSFPVTITGINVGAPISVVDGLMSIGCTATFVGGSAFIYNGQTVCVRHIAATTAGTSVTTTLTVGTVSATFTSTTVAPLDTTITSMPPNPSTGAGATFTFVSSDPSTTLRFECAIDGGAWSTCTSPRVYSVPQGSHTFQVRAVSNAGLADPTPASYTWQVNLAQPDTTITSGPSDPTPIASTTATFTFTSNDAGATFECSLDNAAYNACTSPKSYSNLIQGGHLFNVRAVGAFGTLDPTPARRIFTVDTTAPDTVGLSGVPVYSNSASATLTFYSHEANTTFQCRLDAAPFAACASPATYAGIADGSHTFFVRAIDAAGNIDPAPASISWTVDTVPPETTITVYPPAVATTNGASFSFSSNEQGAGFECSLDGAAFAACFRPVGLSNLTQGSHTFAVRALDLATNLDPTPATYTWFVDSVPSETTITSGPSAFWPSTTATFVIVASEPGATLQCSLDGAGFAPCSSPVTYSGLAEGLHTFVARAIDAVGNVDPSPASSPFTVMVTPPDTTIVSSPPALTSSGAATFAFTASYPNTTFRCVLDGATAASCTSPVAYSGLADGAHAFSVAAVDLAGNVDPTPATYAWTVDSTAAETTITSGPPAISASSSATFAFVSNEAGATFECSLDNAPYASCVSPVTYAALADGNHLFQVRAVDAAGNVDSSPGVMTWAVDSVAPDTSITSAPSAMTSSQNASFTFSSSESGATFACALDGAAYAPCTSPATYSALADGMHTFQVRAADSAGNADASPASHQWTIDTTAPDTVITSGPALATSATSATFTFQSNEPGATFQCGLDSADYTACANPVSFSGLADGAHRLIVRAVDAAGNADASPSVFVWAIDTTSPDTIIDSSPPLVTAQTGASFSFSTDELAANFECRLDGAAFASCASPIAYAGLAEGFHTFEVRAIDPAGNTDSQPAAWTWKIDTTPPDTLLAFTPAASPSNSTSFTATLASEPGATFECRVDGSAWIACSSGYTVNGLADGSHTFEARARDGAGNIDASPALRTWVIDTVAPDTSIAQGPSGTVASNSALFSFASTESPAVFFECSLDGAAFSSCGPGLSLPGLAEGSHTLQVRAKDMAGNVDATPASRTWTVDTVAPETTITAAPSGTVASSAASIAFSSEAGATFECRLDGAAFAPCTSPASYSGLAQGSHTFDVRAKDGVGNVDATPASRTWVVDTIAPDTTITGGPSGNNNPNTATFTFTSTESGASFECKLDTGAFAACASGITYSNLPRADHTFQVRAIDAAGNVDATPATRAWRSK